METLVIPFSARHRFTARAPSGEFRYDLFLEGEIVAIAQPSIFVERPPEAKGTLRLWWPTGFRLQQSRRFDPAECVDLESQPPLDISFSTPAGFLEDGGVP